MKPIFIFSLPRSGSTLLQRLLCTHPSIAGASEPWILLPMLYSVRDSGIFAEYSHATSHRAISEFAAGLPNGTNEFYESIEHWALDLYARAAPQGAAFFVDKTPRYHLVVEKILETFGDAKFIFLWRNPLAVCASMIETWGNGRWNLYRYKVDLYQGLANLTDAYVRFADSALTIQYEQLILDPESSIKAVAGYLDLEFEDFAFDKFDSVKFTGSLGDPTGVQEYTSISRAPIDKWKRAMNRPLRRRMMHDYLTWLGEDRLTLMGYELDGLLADLQELPTKWNLTPIDLADVTYGWIHQALEPHLFKRKFIGEREWAFLRSHS